MKQIKYFVKRNKGIFVAIFVASLMFSSVYGLINDYHPSNSNVGSGNTIPALSNVGETAATSIEVNYWTNGAVSNTGTTTVTLNAVEASSQQTFSTDAVGANWNEVNFYSFDFTAFVGDYQYWSGTTITMSSLGFFPATYNSGNYGVPGIVYANLTIGGQTYSWNYNFGTSSDTAGYWVVITPSWTPTISTQATSISLTLTSDTSESSDLVTLDSVPTNLFTETSVTGDNFAGTSTYTAVSIPIITGWTYSGQSVGATFGIPQYTSSYQITWTTTQSGEIVYNGGSSTTSPINGVLTVNSLSFNSNGADPNVPSYTFSFYLSSQYEVSSATATQTSAPTYTYVQVSGTTNQASASFNFGGTTPSGAVFIPYETSTNSLSTTASNIVFTPTITIQNPYSSYAQNQLVASLTGSSTGSSTTSNTASPSFTGNSVSYTTSASPSWTVNLNLYGNVAPTVSTPTITYKNSNSEISATFTISQSIFNGELQDIVINWGDGTTTSISNLATGTYTYYHNYTGTYQGTFSQTYSIYITDTNVPNPSSNSLSGLTATSSSVPYTFGSILNPTTPNTILQKGATVSLVLTNNNLTISQISATVNGISASIQGTVNNYYISSIIFGITSVVIIWSIDFGSVVDTLNVGYSSAIIPSNNSADVTYQTSNTLTNTNTPTTVPSEVINPQGAYINGSLTGYVNDGTIASGSTTLNAITPPSGSNNQASLTGTLYGTEGTTYYSAPSNIVYGVPVTLTNSASSATPNPYNQIVTVDSNTYSGYESSDLSNVEWFTGTTVIPSWIESGASNTATSTIYYLRVPLSVGASSTATIYLGFTSTSTNLFSPTGNEGVYPTFTSTYAQYDNGAVVFPYYWNFAGTTLPSGITDTTNANGGAGFTINNGWSAKDAYGVYSAVGFYTTTPVSPSNYMWNVYSTNILSANSASEAQMSNSNTMTTGGQNVLNGWGGDFSGSVYSINSQAAYYNSGTGYPTEIYSYTSQYPSLISQYWSGSTIISYLNDAEVGSTTSFSAFSQDSTVYGTTFEQNGGGGGDNTIAVQYAFWSIVPVDNNMPSTSFGSGSVPSTLVNENSGESGTSTTSITQSGNTFTSGTYSWTFTAPSGWNNGLTLDFNIGGLLEEQYGQSAGTFTVSNSYGGTSQDTSTSDSTFSFSGSTTSSGTTITVSFYTTDVINSWNYNGQTWSQSWTLPSNSKALDLVYSDSGASGSVSSGYYTSNLPTSITFTPTGSTQSVSLSYSVQDVIIVETQSFGGNGISLSQNPTEIGVTSNWQSTIGISITIPSWLNGESLDGVNWYTTASWSVAHVISAGQSVSPTVPSTMNITGSGTHSITPSSEFVSWSDSTSNAGSGTYSISYTILEHITGSTNNTIIADSTNLLYWGYNTFRNEQSSTTEGQYQYDIPDSFNYNYMTVFYPKGWTFVSSSWTTYILGSLYGGNYITFTSITGIGTIGITLEEPITIAQPLGTMSIGVAPSIAINGEGGFNLPTGEIEWFANGQPVNSNGFSVIVGQSVRLQAYAFGVYLNISTGSGKPFKTSLNYTPTSSISFLQTYLNMSQIQLNNYNQYEVQVYAKINNNWQLEDLLAPGQSGSDVYLPSGIYSWKYIELNTSTGSIVNTIYVKPTNASGVSWITISGETLYTLSQQLTFNTSTIQKSVQSISIQIALNDSEIKNLTLGISVNLSATNSTIQHVLQNILVSDKFINSTILNENTSLQARFNTTNSIIHTFESNITVLDTYTNDTVNTINKIITTVNTNLSTANSIIGEIKTIDTTNFTALNSTVKQNYLKLISSENFVNSTILAANNNITLFYKYQNDLINTTTGSIAITQTFTNDTVNVIKKLENTMNQNLTLENATINEVKFIASQNFTALNSTIKNNFATIISNQTFENDVLGTVNNNVTLFYKYQNDLMNSTKQSILVKEAILNSTANLVNTNLTFDYKTLSSLIGTNNLNINQNVIFSKDLINQNTIMYDTQLALNDYVLSGGSGVITQSDGTTTSAYTNILDPYEFATITSYGNLTTTSNITWFANPINTTWSNPIVVDNPFINFYYENGSGIYNGLIKIVYYNVSTGLTVVSSQVYRIDNSSNYQILLNKQYLEDGYIIKIQLLNETNKSITFTSEVSWNAQIGFVWTKLSGQTSTYQYKATVPDELGSYGNYNYKTLPGALMNTTSITQQVSVAFPTSLGAIDTNSATVEDLTTQQDLTAGSQYFINQAGIQFNWNHLTERQYLITFSLATNTTTNQNEFLTFSGGLVSSSLNGAKTYLTGGNYTNTAGSGTFNFYITISGVGSLATATVEVNGQVIPSAQVGVSGNQVIISNIGISAGKEIIINIYYTKTITLTQNIFTLLFMPLIPTTILNLWFIILVVSLILVYWPIERTRLYTGVRRKMKYQLIGGLYSTFLLFWVILLLLYLKGLV